jgi:hypothetical protein
MTVVNFYLRFVVFLKVSKDIIEKILIGTGRDHDHAIGLRGIGKIICGEPGR